MSTTTIPVLHSDWPQHVLLDSGHKRKLERFGPHLLIRSEPKAWWQPALPPSEWRRAEAECDEEGQWKLTSHGRIPSDRSWTLPFGPLTLLARLTDMSKHIGLFPEQSPQWSWLLQNPPAAPDSHLLSLFGYTGAATLAAASSGHHVTHVDASRPAIAWARENQRLSGLSSAPVRWILDDAAKFVHREITRNRRYHALILDPPSFGRGPKQEIWKAENSLPALLADCRRILHEKPAFVILTLYTLNASALLIHHLLSDMMHGIPGHITIGELTLRPPLPATKSLPLAITGRWQAAP